MTHLKVYRSASRELLMLCAGLLLVLAALDIMWFHQIAGPPEADEDTGALTSTGRSQRRTDLIWGSMFIVAGGGISLVAAGGLVVRRPVVDVTEDGLDFRIAGPQRSLNIPWSNVSWVHSGTDGEDEAVPPRVFLVHVFDRSHYPDQLWGADWDGTTLMVDADSWSVRDVEVVAHSQMALDAWRRRSQEAAAVDEEPA
jgi:hypothetical protein